MVVILKMATLYPNSHSITYGNVPQYGIFYGVHVQVSILSTRDTIFPIQGCLIRNCSDKWEIRNCLHGKMSVYRCQQYIIFLYNAILKNNRINFEISLRNLWVVTFFIGNQSFVKEMLTF